MTNRLNLICVFCFIQGCKIDYKKCPGFCNIISLQPTSRITRDVELEFPEEEVLYGPIDADIT